MQTNVFFSTSERSNADIHKSYRVSAHNKTEDLQVKAIDNSPPCISPQIFRLGFIRRICLFAR
jgi:hypothetical protein